MANPAQPLYNVLRECRLKDPSGLASDLDEEDLSWSDIQDAYGRDGDSAVHTLLGELASTGARAKIIQYLYLSQQSAASSSACA